MIPPSIIKNSMETIGLKTSLITIVLGCFVIAMLYFNGFRFIAGLFK